MKSNNFLLLIIKIKNIHEFNVLRLNLWIFSIKNIKYPLLANFTMLSPPNIVFPYRPPLGGAIKTLVWRSFFFSVKGFRYLTFKGFVDSPFVGANRTPLSTKVYIKVWWISFCWRIIVWSHFTNSTTFLVGGGFNAPIRSPIGVGLCPNFVLVYF